MARCRPFSTMWCEVGDEIELSEPIGGHFIWRAEDGGPVLLIGGGSGVVPFMSMARQRALERLDARRCCCCSRPERRHDLLFSEELDRLRDRRDGFDIIATLTREA